MANTDNIKPEDIGVIETYFDPNGFKGGKFGCWRARHAERHGLHGAGTTEENAINDLLLTLKTEGLSGRRDFYKYRRLGK